MYVYTDIVDTGHHHKYKYTSLIEQFYQEEIARKAEEATFTPLEITVSSADMALISTISKRFSKDKSVLVREAVSQALLDMFSALEPIERKILAKDADELAKGIAAEIAEEQSIDGLEVSGINWVQQDKNCIKEERKAEKEKAMQQAQAAKAVLNNQSNSSSADEPQPEMTEQAHTAELDDDEDLLADTTDESNDELVTESEDEIKAEESEKERSIFG
jgi:hypothetical protein